MVVVQLQLYGTIRLPSANTSNILHHVYYIVQLQESRDMVIASELISKIFVPQVHHASISCAVDQLQEMYCI